MKLDTIAFTVMGIILNAMACLLCAFTGQIAYSLFFMFNTGIMSLYMYDRKNPNACK